MLTYLKNYIITFRYVKLISYILTKLLYNHIPVFPSIDSKIIPKNILDSFKSLHEQSKLKPYKLKYVYYYGFQIIIGGINKFILLIIPGLLLNILPQLLLTTISFASLRIWTGGLHLDSYTKCTYISLLSFTLIALLAKYIILNQFITMLIFLSIYLLILIYAPIEHKNKPIKENKKLRFKIIALFVLTILVIINMFTNNIIISNSIVYGILLVGIIMLPIVNKLR